MDVDRNRRWAVPASLFAATQALYLATLHRGLPPLDSSELIAAALVKGIPHPPGYPLYTMLGILFSRLPFGAPEARINYVSAFCAGVAVVATYFACLEAAAGIAASVLAASMLAVGCVFWRYSLVAEVLTLHCAIVAGLLLLAFRYRRRRDPRLVVGGALLFGLGISHLHTIVLIGPPLALMVGDRSLLRRPPSFWFAVAGAFALGLLPYAYLPWAAAHHPPLNTGDPSTWTRFVDVFLRRAYGTAALATSTVAGDRWGNMSWHVGRFGRTLLADEGVLGVAAALLGVQRLWRADRRMLSALLLYLVLNLPFFLWLANAPSTPFFAWVIQGQFGGPLIVLTVCTAAGMTAVLERLDVVLGAPARARAIVALLPLSMLAANYRLEDRSRARSVERMGRLLLDSVEPGAVVVSCTDTMIFALTELHDARGLRPDVVLTTFGVDEALAKKVRRELPDLDLPEGSGRAFTMELIRRADGKRPVYFTFAGNCGGIDVLGDVRGHLVPSGLVYRWLAVPWTRLVVQILERGGGFLATQPDMAQASVGAENDAGVQEVVRTYADAYGNIGLMLGLIGRKAEAGRFLAVRERMLR
ncbi:MAG: protein O-mannosyl-transferase family [Elusimicrobiota bacterium]